MFTFDFKKVHNLLSFPDLYTTSDEYMRQLNSLSLITLNVEPLYVLDIGQNILFTPKLHYYRRLIEGEINRHINEACHLADTDNAGDLAKYIMKLTREAAETIIKESKCQLDIIDKDGSIWMKLSSDGSLPYNVDQKCLELIVFLHIVIAELVCCWMELQERFHEGSYTVPLIYSSLISCRPDCMLNIKRCSTNSSDQQKNKGVIDTKLIKSLTDIFFGDKDKVKDYLCKISNMSSNPEKVRYTAQLVNLKYISDLSCNRKLWSILHDNGYYPPQEPTWNKQMKIYREKAKVESKSCTTDE